MVQTEKKIVIPEKLRKGDIIAVAAPAGHFETDSLAKGIEVLESMGFRVRMPELFLRKGYLAGSDSERANKINALFEDKEIKAISYLDAPPHQPGLLPPWLAERGANDIIAGGMGQRAIDLFNERGINVFVGAPALTPEELVTGFLNETLSFSANYCDH